MIDYVKWMLMIIMLSVIIIGLQLIITDTYIIGTDIAKNTTTHRRLPISPVAPVNSTAIMCMIFTMPGQWTSKGLAVQRTWAPRCHYRRFFYSRPAADSPTLPPGGDMHPLGLPEGRAGLARKTGAALRASYAMFKDRAAWFVKADDDTYLVVENLRWLLASRDPGRPHYLGARITHHLPPRGYNSGGAGYVLSREAVRLVVEEGARHPEACSFSGRYEDVSVGRCLAAFSVFPEDTTDAAGRQTFHPGHPLSHRNNKFPPVNKNNASNNEPSKRSTSKEDPPRGSKKDPPINTNSSHDSDNNRHSKQPTSKTEQHFNKSPLFNINTGSIQELDSASFVKNLQLFTRKKMSFDEKPHFNINTEFKGSGNQASSKMDSRFKDGPRFNINTGSYKNKDPTRSVNLSGTENHRAPYALSLSPETVSFHHLDAAHMHVYDFLLYRLRRSKPRG